MYISFSFTLSNLFIQTLYRSNAGTGYTPTDDYLLCPSTLDSLWPFLTFKIGMGYIDYTLCWWKLATDIVISFNRLIYIFSSNGWNACDRLSDFLVECPQHLRGHYWSGPKIFHSFDIRKKGPQPTSHKCALFRQGAKSFSCHGIEAAGATWRMSYGEGAPATSPLFRFDLQRLQQLPHSPRFSIVCSHKRFVHRY